MQAGNNDVLRFSYGGEEYFAKAYKNKACFRRELYALENFLASEIPVPEVVYKSKSCEGAENGLIVMRKAGGMPLDKIEVRRNEYCYEMGCLLSRIHSLELQTEIEPWIIPAQEIAGQVLAFSEEENIRHRTSGLVEKTFEKFKLSQSVVVSHGDYIERNVLGSDGRITGIVDWECLRAARPEVDLGYCCAFLDIFRNPDEERSFIKGYSLKFDEQLKDEIKLLYKMILARYWQQTGKSQEYQKALSAVKKQLADL
ncbi:MAG TPA: aminoglycoside phosphotransferase family protein [Pyrinomonadaceae bacterium]